MIARNYEPLLSLRGVSQPRSRWSFACSALVLAVALSACATPPSEAPSRSVRSFDFDRDVFAFANELVADYQVDEKGRLRPTARVDPIDFGQRCVLMSRAARQFYLSARFAPELPVADEAIYQERITAVFATDPRRKLPASDPIIIPGYSDLRSFSEVHERLAKQALNQRWLAYLQKGNWRMIFPFWRNQQKGVAEKIKDSVGSGELVVVHAVRFPDIEINHTFLVFAVEEEPETISFHFYDPNEAEQARVLVYDRSQKTFFYPKTFYFAGGPVRAYEVYDGPIY